MEMKTRMTPEWIAKALADNPIAALDNGNYRTCPVRLSFPYLFEPQKPMNAGEEGKYSAVLLFPKGADLNVLHAAVLSCAQENFGSCFQNGSYVGGLHLPFRDQADKSKFDGYVPGAIMITATSKYKPAVVAPGNPPSPVFDASKVYPGVWAIATVNLFKYERKMKKGISFGLQSVMIVADDEKLAGGGGDPAKDYAGVNVETSTSFDPQGQFGAGETQPPAAVDPMKALGLA